VCRRRSTTRPGGPARSAGAKGLALYLETETLDNVDYYTHLGFRVRTEWDVPLDGPHLWGMIREP
jgi:hypothetical protein